MKIIQEINNRISLLIVSIVSLWVIGLAAYLYNYIPIEYQKYFFYNLDRVFIISMCSCFLYIIIDKKVRIAIGTTLFIYLYYTLIVNLKLIFGFGSGWSENAWLIFMAISIVLIFINAIIYVSSSK